MSTVNVVRQLRKRELCGEKVEINPHWIKDVCILCHQDTPYYIATGLHVRRHYVSGFGQMCSSCYYSANNTSTAWMGDDFLDYMY